MAVKILSEGEDLGEVKNDNLSGINKTDSTR